MPQPAPSSETFRPGNSKREDAHELDIVLPCFNPQGNWAIKIVNSYKIITDLLGFAPGLILVNDGSSSGIDVADLDLLRKAIPSLIYHQRLENKGKGFTLREGVGLSHADFVIYTDIDFPYREESLGDVWQALQRGAQVAAGVKDRHYYEEVPALRRAISKALRWMSTRLLRLEISDTQCGLKGFDALGKQVFMQTRIERYLFDLEFLFLAIRRHQLRVVAVPVSLKPGVTFSKMRFRLLLAEALNFLRVWSLSLFSRKAGPLAEPKSTQTP